MIEPESPRGSSAAAIQHHYDADPSFFALWLDPSLCYSCGLWERAETLEEAQLHKLDYHAANARAAGAARVLDIGCGFGGLLRRLVDAHGVARAVGLTLSRTQAAHVAGLRHPRIEARLESWELHSPEAPYEAIVSVGCLEHAARPEQRSDRKIETYRHFFERCRALSTQRARLSIQAIAKGNTPLTRQSALDTQWILDHVYPESELPRLCELTAALEKQYEILHLRNDRLDYARTCQAWLDRLNARQAEAAALAGEATVARFQRYLTICVRQFQEGQASLLRLELARA